MKTYLTLICIACLWACNTSIKPEATLTGQLSNAAVNDLKLEVCGMDTLLHATLDADNRFAFRIPLTAGTYARLSNGKATFPLYLAPGKDIDLRMDADQLKKGNYSSVAFTCGGSKENRLLVFYYEHQRFPSSQELFSRTPAAFRQLMQETVSHNDSLIDAFLQADRGVHDPVFIEQFKLQVKVPLAMSYFYYPTYHALLAPQDTASLPRDFNSFDRLLPKNDIAVYTGVYRYKTYEVTYWNTLLADALADVEEHAIVATYFDRLDGFRLHPRIATDVARTFFTQQVTDLSPEEKQLIRQRLDKITQSTQTSIAK